MDLDMVRFTRMRSASLGQVHNAKRINSEHEGYIVHYEKRLEGAETDGDTSVLTEERPLRPAHPPSGRPAASPSRRHGLAESGCWRGPGKTQRRGAARWGSWPSAFCAVQPCVCPVRRVTPSPCRPSRITQTGRDPLPFAGADFGSRGGLVWKRKGTNERRTWGLPLLIQRRLPLPPRLVALRLRLLTFDAGPELRTHTYDFTPHTC
jgi:hypothetical protein